jgi:Ca2+-binding EF-hand superfamily protein
MKNTVVLISALVFGTAAFAGDFGAMDADADGAISAEEFTASFPDVDPGVFTAADTDQSGALDEAEVAAATEGGLLPAG